MKTVPISENVHKQLKLKMIEMSQYKTIQAFVDDAVTEKLSRV